MEYVTVQAIAGCGTDHSFVIGGSSQTPDVIKKWDIIGSLKINPASNPGYNLNTVSAHKISIALAERMHTADILHLINDLHEVILRRRSDG